MGEFKISGIKTTAGPEYRCSFCGFSGWSSAEFDGKCISCGVKMKIVLGKPPEFAVVDK